MRTLVAVALAAGCTQGPAPAPAPSGPAPNYELACAPANTPSAAQLHCARTDTRTGDVQVVEVMRLPVADGPTAVGAAPAGRFTTTCAATSTTERADFFCVRMNTETGELLLVNLQKVPVVPPRG
jgi:hypothetical protein